MLNNIFILPKYLIKAYYDKATAPPKDRASQSIDFKNYVACVHEGGDSRSGWIFM